MTDLEHLERRLEELAQRIDRIGYELRGRIEDLETGVARLERVAAELESARRYDR